MTGALFIPEDGRFVPTDLARSSWSETAMHGGPPGALIARALEAMQGEAWWVVRLTIDIMGEIPMAPLQVATELERSGRRVQLVEARVTDRDGEPLLRGFAWRVRRSGPLPLPPPVDRPPPTPAPPDDLPPCELHFRNYVDFVGDGADARLFSGHPGEPGRAGMWFRLRVPVVAGEAVTPLQTLMAVVDSANGISWTVPLDRFVFPNTDLGVYLAREPRGDWIGVDAVSYLDPGGRGISDSALFDTDGFLGRANQALFVGERDWGDPPDRPRAPGYRGSGSR